MAINLFDVFVKNLFGSAFRWGRGFSSLPGGHNGIDLPAPEGTAVKEVSSGTVLYAGPAVPQLMSRVPDAWQATGGGIVVLVKTPSGLIEHYIHLSAVNVSTGELVTPGEVIGKVGHTGNATGPHLHYGLFDPVSKKFRDPLPYLFSRDNPASYLSAWNKAIAFPIGHKLTEADVNGIIIELDKAHFFQAKDVIPGFQQLAENQARDKTRQILMAHINEPWSPELQKQLSTEIFGAANAAGDTPFRVEVDGLVAFVNAITNPLTWVKVGAVGLGLVLIVKGSTTIVSKAGA